jgi:hypothetical protein
MGVPTKASQNVWKTEGGQDFIQFVSQTGTVESWIDSTGTGQGNLAGGGITGTIAAGQIAVGSGVNTIGGSASLTFSAGFLEAAATAGIDITDASSSGVTISETSTGKVFIRADAPSQGISLENDSLSAGITLLDLSTSGGGGGGIFINQTGGAGITISGSGTGSLIEIENTGNGGTFIDDSGGGGVGIDAHGHLLALNGTAGGTLSIGGTSGVTAGSFSTVSAIQSKQGIIIALTGTSDERLKTDIVPFVRGLDSINKISPKLYKWNEEGQKRTGFTAEQEFAGFIAQDVQQAIPEAIGQEGDYLSLDTRPIIAALVNSVKELTERIKVLESSQK